MSANPHGHPPLRGRDLLPLALFIGLIYYFPSLGRCAFDYLFEDTSPFAIGANALGESDLSTIVATSQTNDLRFIADYAGKEFAATGAFDYANGVWGTYDIAVKIGVGEVACATTDAATLRFVSTLASSDSVKIYGLISDTFFGILRLKRCAITHGA